jgi:hypothetical protein
MIELSKCNKLLDEGFSLITIGEDKIPNTKWKDQQTKQLSKKDFEIRFNLPTTKGVGIVTGYNSLEVIDVDLKVFSTAKERVNFWETLTSYLEDSILDFHEKFCITKTKNNGFHILYKSKRCKGNQKLATLKGHTEAVIETRGVGGYVFVYDNFLNDKYYTQIDWITDEDYHILFDVIDSFDFKKQEEVKQPKKTINDYDSNLKPWDDFNNKNNVLDIIRDDFEIVRQLNDRIVIKRHSATSAHSGYIFHDNGCMFLHSTGTIYPHQKQISAYVAYTYKHHNGDFNASAKDVYSQGYGERIIKKIPDILLEEKEIVKDVEFPLDIFPTPVKNYILDCNDTLDSVTDYMGGALVWMISAMIGNSLEIEIKKGWKEKAIVWIANVGKAGIGKTPSVKNVLFPLQKINAQEIKNFFKQLERYIEYESLSKDEKKTAEEVQKPSKKQFIANDITVEALVDLHHQNKNAVGVFKDELAGWLKDMNKYREGSDLEFWLSCWSNESVNVNRVTRIGSFVESPFIPVLGGIQPDVLNNFFTSENKDNGFIDRLLITYPDAEIEKYNDKEMESDAIVYYSDQITNFYNFFKFNFTKLNEELEVETVTARFSKKANLVWKKAFNNFTDIQNSDDENEYMKSMYPKQKSYIPRFALIINTFQCFFDGCEKEAYKTITEDSVIKAVKLSEYFVNMAKKVKINSKEINNLKQDLSGKENDFEKIKKMYKKNKSFNKSKASEILGISRQTIYNYIKELKNG